MLVVFGWYLCLRRGSSLAALSLASGPGPTQEELRRRVENGVKEFWYFVRSEVKKLTNVEPSERQKYGDTLLQDLGHQERWVNINTEAGETASPRLHAGVHDLDWKAPPVVVSGKRRAKVTDLVDVQPAEGANWFSVIPVK